VEETQRHAVRVKRGIGYTIPMRETLRLAKAKKEEAGPGEKIQQKEG
jgi:hypothetical protein